MDIILLDFANAFDKVPHTRLLHKLDHYGVRGSVKRWIESFLCHREQRVILDGVRSESAKVLAGVPQGTVLGPLLFLCFINDLPESIKSFQAKLFADDSLLFRVIKNDRDRALLQKDLSALEHWENTWQMSFKVSKGAKIRNQYIQVPHLTQNTNGKETNSQLDITKESQEVSPFPAGDHKAHINRRIKCIANTRQKKNP